MSANVAELIAEAAQEREAGNKAFREGAHSEAVKNYVSALGHNDRILAADPANPAVLEQARKTKIAVFGNLAACHLKAGAFEDAVQAATQALEEEPSNAKVLYRRASAYRKLGNLGMAHLDLFSALEVDPSNAAIQQDIKEVQQMRRAKASPKKKENKLYANMFKGIEGTSNDRAGKDADAEIGQGPFYAGELADSCNVDERLDVRHETFSLLNREVEELKEACPLGLLSVDGPRSVAFVNASTADRKMIANPAGCRRGPWLVEFRIKGPAHEEELEAQVLHPGAYDSVFRVQLCVSSAYPELPPRIRFRSVIQHALIKDSKNEARENERRVGPAFFKELTKRAKKKPGGRIMFTMWDACELLCEMLEHHEHVPLDIDVEHWHSCRKQHCSRLTTIRGYPNSMKHPEIFDAVAGWRREWFDQDLSRVLFTQSAGPERDQQLRELMTEEMNGVYSFQLFTASFCELFLDELENFMKVHEDIFIADTFVDFPGKFLNSIGWEPMADLLLRDVLQPIAALLFPKEGAQLDSIHPFINRYRPDWNEGLDMHKDNSDISFTGCLGRSFEGGALDFCGIMGDPDHRKMSLRYHHKVGRVVTHLGHHRHGVHKTTAGEKVSLVMWCQNIALRSDRDYEDRVINLKGFAPEDGPPDRDCLSWTHDRDFGNFKPYPKGSEPFRKFQWYPTPEAEYHGFRPDGNIKQFMPTKQGTHLTATAMAGRA